MMKFRAAFLLLSFLFYNNRNGQAQDSSSRDPAITVHKNILSTYPLFDAGGAFNLGYEHAFSKKVSYYQWIVYYPFGDNPPLTIKSNQVMGMSQGRFFPLKKAPHGFFTGPFVLGGYTWYGKFKNVF